MDTAVAVALAWQEAANRQDEAGVLARSAPDICILGPRGEARGHEVLVAWLRRAGLTLARRRIYARGDTVVADQHGVWRSLETGDVVGEADVATLFRVKDGVVSSLARYDTLVEALAAARLAEADLHSPGDTNDD